MQLQYVLSYAVEEAINTKILKYSISPCKKRMEKVRVGKKQLKMNEDKNSINFLQLQSFSELFRSMQLFSEFLCEYRKTLDFLQQQKTFENNKLWTVFALRIFSNIGT